MCIGDSPLPLDDINDQARHLVRLMPVLRLRDARFMRRIRNGTVPDSAHKSLSLIHISEPTRH
ncbi:hypothetical protein CQA28_25595 [Citrobacter freundii]|nr:hypothetical protein CQA28_25595 [Citrobacter freundii]